MRSLQVFQKKYPRPFSPKRSCSLKLLLAKLRTTVFYPLSQTIKSTDFPSVIPFNLTKLCSLSPIVSRYLNQANISRRLELKDQYFPACTMSNKNIFPHSQIHNDPSTMAINTYVTLNIHCPSNLQKSIESLNFIRTNAA